jgi:hypothetical protein
MPLEPARTLTGVKARWIRLRIERVDVDQRSLATSG